MEKELQNVRSTERWAHFRFSVIGAILAAPPDPGQLQAQLQELAAKKWRHPISGQWTVLGLSTIERWYYKALRAKSGPVEVLQRKIRSDHGGHPSLNPKLIELLTLQYRQHPSWSYQLHYDNLKVLAERHPDAAPMPACVSVRRYMKGHGLFKRPRRGPVHSPGAQVAERRYEAREVRSYESEYVNGLWHLDFHHGSLRVLLPDGRWIYPILLGILDDHSRLCCHLQWYLAEGARELCHGLCQAFQKRDLPRALLFDNGSAMIAQETEQGLARLGVLSENTLPFSPYQNGKPEAFWGQVEGRLLPMLEGVADLTLDQLNDVSQPWIELEYNRKIHSETEQTPLHRFLNAKNVAHSCPSTEKLQLAFTNRAALKSGDLAGDKAHNQVDAPAHLLFKGVSGALACSGLVPRPLPVFALHGSAHDAQDGRGHRTSHPAAVFAGADIQAVMQAVFDAPILAGQLEQAGGVGLLGAQAGDEPDRLHLLFAALEFADAIQSRHLQDVGKAPLRGCGVLDLDAAPLNAPVSVADLQKLRGKNPPAGGVWLGRAGRFGCP